VLETSGFAAPTPDQLRAWIDTYGVTVTSVIDRDPDPETETFTALGQREQVFIVDLSTMTIVFQLQGSVAGVGNPSVVAAIDEIKRLLSGGP
jgi:hypothetical protein